MVATLKFQLQLKNRIAGAQGQRRETTCSESIRRLTFIPFLPFKLTAAPSTISLSLQRHTTVQYLCPTTTLVVHDTLQEVNCYNIYIINLTEE